DLIEFYEITDRMSGKRLEVVFSKKGKTIDDDWKTRYDKSVAQLKYMTETMLANYPHAKQLAMNRVNGVGVRVSGGGEHPAAKIQPQNNQIPYETLLKFINQSYAEDIV